MIEAVLAIYPALQLRPSYIIDLDNKNLWNLLKCPFRYAPSVLQGLEWTW